MLKDWTKYEKMLYFLGLIIIIIFGLLCGSNLLTIICAIMGTSCAITQAKGKVISQFIGLILVLLYSILSFQNRYYGEVLIYIFVMMPLFILGIISWIRNVDENTNTVAKNKLSKTEWIVLLIISVILFIILYFLLKYFNTQLLVVSTFSMVASLFATYLIARRSKYGFLFYIANDVILLILWGTPVIRGNLVLMPMVLNPMILFINDIYGWKSWNKK